MRMTRTMMLEVLGQDYVRTARAKGLRDRLVVFRHALRNALIPVVSVIGFQLGALMGGAAIIEVIFGLNGLGNTLVQAIFNRDYPLVQATTLFLAAIFVLVNLAVDILYGYLDPRIQPADEQRSRERPPLPTGTVTSPRGGDGSLRKWRNPLGMLGAVDHPADGRGRDLRAAHRALRSLGAGRAAAARRRAAIT